MSKIILNESFFEALGRRWNALWGSIKGQFWQSVRLWINIYEIWKAESQEELDKVVTKGREDIDKIKTRYRSFEEQYAKDNGVFNSKFGNTLLFVSPPAALGYAIYNKLIRDESYRSDIQRLMIDSGFGNEKLFPNLSKYLKDYRAEDPSARIETTDPTTGERTESIVYNLRNSTESAETKKAAESIGVISKIFAGGGEQVSESRIFENKENFESNKEVAKRITKDMIMILKDSGVIEEFQNVGEEMLKVKQSQYQEMVVPAAQTISLMTALSTSESASKFKKIMVDLSRTNKQLKNLSASEFDNQINNALKQIKNSPEIIEDLKEQFKGKDFSDSELRSIIFLQVRDEFTKNIIGFLESFYESLRDLIMEGATTEGLEKMKKSKVGKEYAKSAEENIQLLDNAIISLKRLAESQGENK